MSEVTVSGVLPATAALTEIQSSSGLALRKGQETLFPEANMKVPAFDQTQGTSPEKNINLPVGPLPGAETRDMGYVDAVPGFVDFPIPAASDELSETEDVDVLLDDIHKLPGINDVFWEQFLDSPLTGDTDGINTGKDNLMEQEGEWDKMNNLNNLTEQMGLLASASHIG
ncbi:hypothetical protein RD792_005664 [Penstemon davidsonii]|uniref:Uncharacterized protein n=1 Tax=Penstemon davidsonii TaxID=160366 RepID=A0ABR0DES4_9LAMI|nr:hypothetical protein RD792_005664 [Penstemon davidsonii]